jgi:hypothetical protein
MKFADFLNDAKANRLPDSAHEVEVVEKYNHLEKLMSKLHGFQSEKLESVQDDVISYWLGLKCKLNIIPLIFIR